MYILGGGSIIVECLDERVSEDISSLPGPEIYDPLLRAVAGQTRKRIVAAIDDLPERERVILSLYYCEELTMTEIAAVLDVSASRVSQLRSSAVVQIRAAIGEL